MPKGLSWRPKPGNIRHRIIPFSGPRSFSWPLKVAPMTKLPPAFRSRARSLASGANDSLRNARLVWTTNPEPGGRPFFPPEVVVQVKALACELPAQTDLPLSRFSRQDLAREVVARGIVAQIEATPPALSSCRASGRTLDIQHPTSKNPSLRSHWMLGVRCWLLDVSTESLLSSQIPLSAPNALQMHLAPPAAGHNMAPHA